MLRRMAGMTLAGLLLASLGLLMGCGAPSSPLERQEQRNEPVAAPPVAEPPVVKKCSDYASGQEVLADEQADKLTPEDKESLDPNGDGRLCNEPGTQWKDTRTHVEGLPPFEVAFVADGDFPQGVKGGTITVDISSPEEALDESMLEAIGWEVIRQVGPGSKTGYRVAIIDYRTAPSYREMDALAVYVADQKAADAANAWWREEHPTAEIDFFIGEVPEGGYLAAYRW